MSARRRVMTIAAAFLREECGATAAEYATMLALIILVSVAAIVAVGGQMQAIYDHIDAVIP